MHRIPTYAFAMDLVSETAPLAAEVHSHLCNEELVFTSCCNCDARQQWLRQVWFSGTIDDYIDCYSLDN